MKRWLGLSTTVPVHRILDTRRRDGNGRQPRADPSERASKSTANRSARPFDGGTVSHRSHRVGRTRRDALFRHGAPTRVRFDAVVLLPSTLQQGRFRVLGCVSTPSNSGGSQGLSWASMTFADRRSMTSAGDPTGSQRRHRFAFGSVPDQRTPAVPPNACRLRLRVAQRTRETADRVPGRRRGSDGQRRRTSRDSCGRDLLRRGCGGTRSRLPCSGWEGQAQPVHPVLNPSMSTPSSSV